MQEEALQAAFEVKAACDEISRKLLRWHWEHKPGSHSLDSLIQHVAQRREESPDYYDRTPDLSGKTSWQQLDTTICMRVLLDPEKDAARPLDLLGNTEHPGAARRACNAVRTARNKAAHAADRTEAAQAAILFNEAVESLEESYAGTAFRENELARYYREAEDFLARCGAKEPSAPRAEEQEQPAERRTSRAASGSAQSKNSRSRKQNAARPAAKNTGKKKQPTGNRAEPKKKTRKNAVQNKTVWAVLLAAVVLGLLMRAIAMGLL